MKCIPALVSRRSCQCVTSLNRAEYYGIKASPDFFVANETAGHSRGVTSALNALRTFMMAADSQNQKSLNVEFTYCNIHSVAPSNILISLIATAKNRGHQVISDVTEIP